MEKIREMMEDPTTPIGLIQAEYRLLRDQVRVGIPVIHVELNRDGRWEVKESDELFSYERSEASEEASDASEASDEEIDPSLTTHQPTYVKVYYANVTYDDGTKGYIWQFDDFDPKVVDCDADEPQLALMEYYEPFVTEINTGAIRYESEYARIVPYDPSLVTQECQEIIDRYKETRRALVKRCKMKEDLDDLHRDLCKWAEETAI